MLEDVRCSQYKDRAQGLEPRQGQSGPATLITIGATVMASADALNGAKLDLIPGQDSVFVDQRRECGVAGVGLSFPTFGSVSSQLLLRPLS